jgi:hypothetical protein
MTELIITILSVSGLVGLGLMLKNTIENYNEEEQHE